MEIPKSKQTKKQIHSKLSDILHNFIKLEFIFNNLFDKTIT